MRDLCTIEGDKLRLHFHDGQRRAWRAPGRFVLVLAGTQGGKTSFGPHWLLREIQRSGQGDYLVVAPTFSLLDLKALPAFLWLFSTVLRLGRYTASPSRKFVFTDEGQRRVFGASYNPLETTRVIFGYATEPESLESATARAAWLDEAGQRRFKLGSWEAVRRRLSLSRGRVLITTSLYCSNFVKTLYDQAQAGNRDVSVVQFESVLNPAFSRDEFEDARINLARWKFRMQYQAQWEKPAGVIYDCVETGVHFVPRFTIPRDWRRLVGLDFGARNTAAVFIAEEPLTKRLYVYREYHQGGESVGGHVRRLLQGERPDLCVGGSVSEDEWRKEYANAGLGVRRPSISDVEVGIDRVYAALQARQLYVFDDLLEVKEELLTYSRELDANGQPTEKIADKETYHLLDGLRYIVSEVRQGKQLVRRAVLHGFGGVGR